MFNTIISRGLELSVEIVMPGKVRPWSEIEYRFISLLPLSIANKWLSCIKIDCKTSPISNISWIFSLFLKTDIEPFPWPKFPSLAINNNSSELLSLLFETSSQLRWIVRILKSKINLFLNMLFTECEIESISDLSFITFLPKVIFYLLLT